jgi:nucleoside-diphosphate-sugar epimerase
MKRAARRISDGTAVNLCTGLGTTFIDATQILAHEGAHYGRIACDESKPEGAKVRVGDTARMRELLEWQPEVQLRSGLARTLASVAEEIARDGPA